MRGLIIIKNATHLETLISLMRGIQKKRRGGGRDKGRANIEKNNPVKSLEKCPKKGRGGEGPSAHPPVYAYGCKTNL